MFSTLNNKRLLSALAVLCLLSLACGLETTAQMPASVEKYGQISPSATQAGILPSATPQATRTPVMLFVAGCWNTRLEPTTDSYSVAVVCDQPIKIGEHRGAWVSVDGGWICAAAVNIGKQEDCK